MTRKPASRDTKAFAPRRLHEKQVNLFQPLSCRRQHNIQSSFRVISCPPKAAFVSGGAMKPAGLAMTRSRRPAQPRLGADVTATSRREATHHFAGFRARAPAHHSILFFVPFRVRRRRLSCLTMRHARRAGRSRRRASSSLELARRHELHGRRTPTDASVSFRARASAPIPAIFFCVGVSAIVVFIKGFCVFCVFRGLIKR